VIAPNVQRLAPMRVRPKGAGIYGTLAASRDLHAVGGAKVFVAGARQTVISDSAGEYFVELKAPGTFVLRVTAAHYASDVFVVEVKKDEVAEASRLLDASDAVEISDAQWQDFDQRLRWRAMNSALATGAELRRTGGMLSDAIQLSRSFSTRGLRIGEATCVFINGQPKPGLWLDAVPVDDIYAVELYGVRGTIAANLVWPSKLACGLNAGKKGGGPGIVRYAVIWMKR
jgi:hypothetical protein